MRFSNWKQVFENDTNNDKFNSQAEAIINLTIDSISNEDCISNIKNEPGFLAIGFAPITEEIQVFHHVTSIGGTLACPDKAIVGLSGFTSLTQISQFPADLFTTTSKVKVPSWTTINAIKTPAQVLSTTAPTRASALVFRPILHIPPLLYKAFIDCPSYKPEDLFMACVAAINAFDGSLAPDSTTPKASTSCRRVLFFLWATATKTIDPVVTVPPTAPFILPHHKTIQDLHILPSGMIPPGTTGVSSPSAETFTALAGAVSTLTDHLEKDSDDRKSTSEDKKNKFGKLPAGTQKLILFASAKSELEPKEAASDELLKFLACPHL